MRSNFSLRVFQSADLQVFAVACLASLGFMLVFSLYAKVYDLSTAAFFALGLGWMARGKLAALYGAFPLMCLNRESVALLTLVFAVYFLGKLSWGGWMRGMAWQASVFVIVRLGLMWLYRGNAGADVLFRLHENLEMFTFYPPLTVLHWAGFAWICWRVSRSWKLAHPLLRTAWLVLFPILLAEYLVVGFAFEVRVFAEVWGVVVSFLLLAFRLGRSLT